MTRTNSAPTPTPSTSPAPSTPSTPGSESESERASLHIAYSDAYLQWLLGSGDGSHPTNPVRAKLATEILVDEPVGTVVVLDPTTVDPAEVRAAIESIHDRDYVSTVLDEGRSSEWSGRRPEMGATALTMFAGTHLLVTGMLAGDITVGFNPQGAKHHAAYAHSSGFCVFNDMAWAATEFASAGLRPLYVDWDIHAGDGVQHLLENTNIPTLSVHNHSTYPSDRETITRDLARAGQRHTAHDVDRSIYNWGVNPGDGDDALIWAIDEMREVIDAYQPDVILLAAGADGHTGNGNLGSLNNYSYAGFDYASRMVAEAALKYSAGRVLIGGAGGYQPLDHTPRLWANVVKTISGAATAAATPAAPTTSSPAASLLRAPGAVLSIPRGNQ